MSGAPASANMDAAVRAIARAVLYEGYILWPYRRSALKNRSRWTFGGVYPKDWTKSGHADDACRLRTQFLLWTDGSDPFVHVTLRFLHVLERRVHALSDSGLHPVDALEVGEERYLSWDEAVEREVATAPLRVSDGAESAVRIAVDAGGSTEWIRDTSGERRAALVRAWEGLSGEVVVSVKRLPVDGEAVYRITVDVRNNTSCSASEGRDATQRRAFISTHVIATARSASFISMVDPPPALESHVAACENVGAWPVLVGEAGRRDTMLASPIILPDHPRVAPESPGDLFDGCEIDELLALNIRAMTDAEKAEMRATDPRASEILQRTAGLGPTEMMRMHGVIREVRPTREDA